MCDRLAALRGQALGAPRNISIDATREGAVETIEPGLEPNRPELRVSIFTVRAGRLLPAAPRLALRARSERRATRPGHVVPIIVTVPRRAGQGRRVVLPAAGPRPGQNSPAARARFGLRPRPHARRRFPGRGRQAPRPHGYYLRVPARHGAAGLGDGEDPVHDVR